MADTGALRRPRTRTPRSDTMVGVTWRRFSRHRMAVISLGLVTLLALLSALAPWLSRYDPDKPQLSTQLQPPSGKHLLGTDDLGRDLLTRILFGGRISMSIGVLAMLLAVVIGTTVGAVAGYYGGWADNLLMRLTDLMLSIPSLFLLILMTLLLRTFPVPVLDRKSTRLNSSHHSISYAVFC